MPVICYDTAARDRLENNAGRLRLVDAANDIVTAYQARGFDLTLRQLYYQFVAKGLIENNDREYKRLGDILNDARMGGLLDWKAMVDRTRYVRANSHWEHPSELVEACSEQYLLDRWDAQPTYVEVWIEKDALVGVLQSVCPALDVPYFSCRGYTSLSEMWTAAMRIRRKVDAGKQAVVLHFGDHDPSGIDMTRDIEDRLRTLGELHTDDFEVRRLALTIEQVQEINPPPNPAKISDSRSDRYIANYGTQSWELDALPPEALTALVQGEITDLLDAKQWAKDTLRQTKQRKLLVAAAKQLEKTAGN